MEEVDFLYVSKEIHFFLGNDCTYQESKDIFFLKGGMGKKSYYYHLSIQALYHILSLVILHDFAPISCHR